MHLRDTILLVFWKSLSQHSLRGISGAPKCSFSRQAHVFSFFLSLRQFKRQDLLKRYNSVSNYGKTMDGLAGLSYFRRPCFQYYGKLFIVMLGLPFKATGSVEGLGSLANPFVRYCKNMENMTIVMTIRVHLRFELYFRQCAFKL